MIVDPDFLDHWRTRMVVDALGDELAPTYILRLWAHCQTRKNDRFTIPTAGLKAQCRYAGDAVQFEQALTDAGFIAREGDTIHILGWAEQNAALLAAWENGAKGGRPPKPKQNPPVLDDGFSGDPETESKPTGNPDETQGEPNHNPDETDKSRSDKNSPSLRSGEKRARAPKGSRRAPDGFEVTPEMQAWVEEKAPLVDWRRQTEKFRDWEFQKPRSDWPAAWRTWMGRAQDDAESKRAAAPRGSLAEPAWRIEQRQRTQQAAPGVAVGDPTTFFDVEAQDVTTHRLGR